MEFIDAHAHIYDRLTPFGPKGEGRAIGNGLVEWATGEKERFLTYPFNSSATVSILCIILLPDLNELFIIIIAFSISFSICFLRIFVLENNNISGIKNPIKNEVKIWRSVMFLYCIRLEIIINKIIPNPDNTFVEI